MSDPGKADPTTASGIPLPPVAGPGDVAGGLDERLGRPGEYPFTRGIHPGMYRTRPWTIRQLAGFATAADTNKRYRMLLDRGATGINGVFDYPSLRAVGSDDPRAASDVGRGGVAVDVVDDFDDLFAGIPLDRRQRVAGVVAAGGGGAASGDVPGGGGTAGVPAGGAGRHQPERLPDGDGHHHRPRGAAAGGVVPGRVRRGRVLHPGAAPVEPDQCHWLQLPGGRRRRSAGAGPHPGPRPGGGPGADRPGPGAGGGAASDLVLPRRPRRLLRGDRQVPGGPADVGGVRARRPRRGRRRGPEVPLPRADVGRDDDRPPAPPQHRPQRHPGAVGRARAGRSRSTSTPTTRRCRSPASTPRWWRCTPSTSCCGRRAWPTAPTHWAGAISSST